MFILDTLDSYMPSEKKMLIIRKMNNKKRDTNKRGFIGDCDFR